jgi:prefoldin subunit 5
MARRIRHSQPFSLFAFQDIITSVTGIIVLITLLLTLELIQKVESSTTGPANAFPRQIRQALVETREQVVKIRENMQQEQQAIDVLAAISPGLVKRQLHELEAQIQQLDFELETLRSQLVAATQEQTDWKSRRFDRLASQQELEALDQQVDALESRLEHLRKSNRVVYNPSHTTEKRAWLVDIGPDSVLAAEAGKRSVPLRFIEGRQGRSSSDFIQWAGTRDHLSEYFILLIRPLVVARYGEIRAELEKLGFQIGFEVIGPSVIPIDSRHGAAY